MSTSIEMKDIVSFLEGNIHNPSAFKKREVTVAREGTKIVLPNDPREMTYDEAIDTLKRLKEQDAVKVGVHEEVNAFPLEGAWALNEVLKKRFGYVMTPEAQKSFFGGENPSAQLVTLEIGPNQKTQVLWGQFRVPGVSGTLECGATKKDGAMIFVINGTILKKDQETIKLIADETREYVAKNSLYKGKAIKVQTTADPQTGEFVMDFRNPPQFLDLSKVDERQLTFTKDVATLIQTNLFTPIERTEECRKYGIPLKRNVLLEGPYGTGKTLTAFVTAKKSVANNWTFIYLDRVVALRDVLLFAKRYQPCVIFAEDIERVVTGGRTIKVDDILNTIDGIDSKNQEFIGIFTTNHVEKIEKAMLRAGRLDAVIHVAPPDAEAAQRLIRIYAGDLVAENEDLTLAGEELRGQIPAFIREVVERSKLFAIGHSTPGDKLRITGEDIRVSAVGMKSHFELVNGIKRPTLTPAEMMAKGLGQIIQSVQDGEADMTEELAVTVPANTTITKVSYTNGALRPQ